MCSQNAGNAIRPKLKGLNVKNFLREEHAPRIKFGKTESPGIHQESSNTRLAQSLEPCTPYYDLRTASHRYDESMTLNTNIIPLTSIFHNLVSDSLNIQNCQILDSESQPRWNCIKLLAR